MNLKKLLNGVKIVGVTVKCPIVDLQFKIVDDNVPPVAKVTHSESSAAPSAKVVLTIASNGGQRANLAQEGLTQAYTQINIASSMHDSGPRFNNSWQELGSEVALRPGDIVWLRTILKHATDRVLYNVPLTLDAFPATTGLGYVSRLVFIDDTNLQGVMVESGHTDNGNDYRRTSRLTGRKAQVCDFGRVSNVHRGMLLKTLNPGDIFVLNCFLRIPVEMVPGTEFKFEQMNKKYIEDLLNLVNAHDQAIGDEICSQYNASIMKKLFGR